MKLAYALKRTMGNVEKAKLLESEVNIVPEFKWLVCHSSNSKVMSLGLTCLLGHRNKIHKYQLSDSWLTKGPDYPH